MESAAVSSEGSANTQSAQSAIDNGKINTVVLVQRQLFAKQLEAYQDILLSIKAAAINPPTSAANVTLPEIFTRRGLSTSLQQQNRLLDNEEVMLLNILSAEGTISTAEQLKEFMVLLTRVTKIEHRALCLHVMEHALTPACARLFVMYQGFKILRKWIKTAEFEDCCEELRAIVAVCKALPFDSYAVKDSEVGKALRKLLKHTSDDYDVGPLQADVRDIVKCWTEQLAKQQQPLPVNVISEGSDIASNTQLASLAESMNKKLADRDPSLYPAPKTTASPLLLASISNANSAPVATVKPASGVAATKASGATAAATSTSATVAARKPTGATSDAANSGSNSVKKAKTATEYTAVASTATGAAAISKAAVAAQAMTAQQAKPTAAIPAAPAVSAASREKMAEEARRFLLAQSQTQNPSQPQIGDSGILGNSSPTAKLTFSFDDVASKKPVGPQPGKSCLKRKGSSAVDSSGGTGSGASSAEPASKRIKAGIQWADEAGGSLREVHTFEIELPAGKDGSHGGSSSGSSGLRSTSGYNKFKDSVKKEKQLEKDSHLNKVNDAMQPTVPWKAPSALTLSVDIQDTLNACAAVASKEKEAQVARLVYILEARYFDDSLIPADPEESPNVRQPSVAVIANGSADGTTTMVTIPWLLPGAEPDEVPMAVSGGDLTAHHDGTRGMGDPYYGHPTPHYSHNSGGHNGYEYATNMHAHSLPPADMYRAMPPMDSQSSANLDHLRERLRYATANAPSHLPVLASLSSHTQSNYNTGLPSQPQRSMLPPQPPNHLPSLPPQHHQHQQLPQHQSMGSYGPSAAGKKVTGPGSRPGNKNAMLGKANTPCRFYNTKGGCQFGDKCEFGHFRSDAGSGSGGNPLPTQNYRRPVGPGAREKI